MNSGVVHLSELPAYVINMDRSTERWSAFRRVTAPYLGAVTRVSAVDGYAAPTSEVRTFAARARHVSDSAPELRITPRTTLNYWRGSMGCYLSHLTAIDLALRDGHPRFLVLEDDARLRPELAAVTAAPAEVGVHIWGGALLGGSYTTHARRAAKAPSSNVWRRIEPTPAKVRNRYQTTAIEFDRASAVDWAVEVAVHPQAYDSSWWFGMLAVPTFVPQVEVIYQELTLESTRSPSATAARRRAARRLEAE